MGTQHFIGPWGSEPGDIGSAAGPLDASGLIPIAQLPPAALTAKVLVANEAERFALTSSQVQAGDLVRQTDTGRLYEVVDVEELDNSSGYQDLDEASMAALQTHAAGSDVHAIGGVTGLQAALDAKASALNSWVSLAGTTSTACKVRTTIPASLDGYYLVDIRLSRNNSTAHYASVLGFRLSGSTVSGTPTISSLAGNGIFSTRVSIESGVVCITFSSGAIPLDVHMRVFATVAITASHLTGWTIADEAAVGSGSLNVAATRRNQVVDLDVTQTFTAITGAFSGAVTMGSGSMIGSRGFVRGSHSAFSSGTLITTAIPCTSNQADGEWLVRFRKRAASGSSHVAFSLSFYIAANALSGTPAVSWGEGGANVSSIRVTVSGNVIVFWSNSTAAGFYEIEVVYSGALTQSWLTGWTLTDTTSTGTAGTQSNNFGAIVMNGALSGATTIGMAGALTGATDITASGTVTGTTAVVGGTDPGGTEPIRSSGAIRATGSLILTNSGVGMRSNTADGADNKSIAVNGGGSLTSGNTRGGGSIWAGNEHATTPGAVIHEAGNVASAYIDNVTGGTSRLKINHDGSATLDATFAASLAAALGAGGVKLVASLKFTGTHNGTNTTWVAIPWDAEDLDSNGWHDPVTNNTRLTIAGSPTRIKFRLWMQKTAFGATKQFAFRKNGSTYAYQWAAAIADNIVLETDWFAPANGDYWEAVTYHDGWTAIGLDTTTRWEVYQQ